MSENYNLRKISFEKNDDVKQCLDIYNYYILNSSATFEEEALSLSCFEKRIKNIALNYPFFIVEKDNEILGYAYLDKFNERSAYRYTADLSIYLKEDCVSKNLGSILYEKIESEAKNAGFRTIVSIITENNEKSINFHKKFGFLKAGFLKDIGEKFGKRLGVYYFIKEI